MEQDTETRIFEAARAVFVEQGFDGARMQEIADRAGINKALLHYYYRSKARLFEAVFRASAAEVLGQAATALRQDQPLPDRLTTFVHTYIDLIRANPHLPAFVLEELRRNPDALKAVVAEHTPGLLDALGRGIEDAVAAGRLRRIDPAHLLAHLIGLCIIPFIARPMLQTATQMDDAAYDAFLEARKEEVSAFIHRALVP
ncbi:TetR family transcriptional regulator [Rhodothermaceae bacterium RA]|nr:TetR family transcriptional regulator [Rhodothermaceae bacterium RA]